MRGDEFFNYVIGLTATESLGLPIAYIIFVGGEILNPSGWDAAIGSWIRNWQGASDSVFRS